MRVLIVKLSSLGDVVHAMAAVQDIRAAIPGVQIDWVVERGFAPLVARCQGVSRVIACDLRKWRKSLFASETRHAWKQFKTELKSAAYDAVIDLQGLTKSALVSRLARCTSDGKRYGLANQTDGSSFEAPARWLADVPIQVEPHIHAVERSRVVCASALNYQYCGPARFGLMPMPASCAVAQDIHPFVTSKPVVALVHGTSRADKEWPLDHWIALGQALNHSGFAVALPHGSKQEFATGEKIANALEDSRVWPSVSLDKLVDALGGCAGVIGVDSGLSHIAVALDLPHVQIYNFDTAWRTGPLAVSGKPADDGSHRKFRQFSVFSSPYPSVAQVWALWEQLETPVFPK